MIRKSDGFALIDILFVCSIMGILCAIAVPRMLLAKQSAGAASAIGSMRAINSAQLTFALTCGGGFYAPDLTTLGRSPVGGLEGFISPNLGGANAVTRSGYLVQVEATPFAGSPASCNGLAAGGAGQGFRAGGDALEPSNVRFFATNANGQIYEHTSTLLASMPEVGSPAIGHTLQ